jgi:hypothetical protein
LNLHHQFRGKEVGRTINVRAKLYPVLRDLSKGGQRKYLKPPRIGKDVPSPTGKPMESFEMLEHLHPGAQVQMVGIPQNEGKADLFQFLVDHRFYRAMGTHGHEYGSFHRTMRKV